LTGYYQQNLDISTAKKFCETTISLALSTRNTKMEGQALANLAQISWFCGEYLTAQVHANMAQRLARISADLYREAQALRIMSMCCYSLGNYKQSIFLCSRARDLLALCGMSSGQLDHYVMNTQAEIHKLKSEYVAARSIHSRILQDSPVDQNFYTYGLALLNVAEIDVAIGAPKDDVQRNCDAAKKIFNTAAEVTVCDTILADLYLREGKMLEAKTLFERCINISLGHSEIMAYCLERLGNFSCWGFLDEMSSQTTVFLVHSVRQKKKLGIHKALQFIGDVFLAQDDEHTAISLFTVALEGFTYMDVHRSRAECMLRLGDISRRHGDLLKAVELWETARPLFEQSSQAKQIEHIDQRLADVNENMLGQNYGINHLEDMEGLNLDDEKEIDLVAV
jgi:tetratricopeptide (TPR) repeat protein